ncbi:DUF1631 family protein [Pseudomonas sp. Marseille-QA0892]
MKEPNDSPARPRPARIATGHSPVVLACRTLLIEHMADGVEQVFLQADDTLFDAAQCAENNQVQALFLDALRDVRTLRASLVREAVGRLASYYDFYFTPKTHEPAPSSSTEPLALIDQDVFEARLQAEHAIARAHNDNVAILATLQERFAKLEGGKRMHGESPISPKRLSDSFYGTLENSPLHLKVRAVLFTLFDQHTLRTAGKLYARIDGCLDEAGVPRLPSPARPNAKHGAGQAPSSPGALPATTPDVIDQLDDLLALLYHASAQSTVANDMRRASQPPSRAQHVTLARLDGLLAGLQRKTPQHERHNLRRALTHSLTIQAGEPQQPMPHHAQIIDLTDLLFSHIATDPLISKTIRPALSELHVPFLRAALRAPDILTNAAHPLRQLFDRLCQAAELWSTADADTLNLAEAINETETLLGENGASPRRIEAAIGTLDELAQELTRRSQLREKRAVEAARGQDRLEAARSRTTAVVSRVCGGVGLPTTVERFMRGTWQDVLIFAHLRHGETSRTWQHLLDVTEALGRTFTVGKPAGMDWEAIVTGVTSGLNMLGHFSEQNIERIRHDLTSASEAVLRATPADVRQRSLTPQPPPASPDPEREQRPPGKPNQHAPLAALSFGQWFEFGEEDARRRLKLAWFSAATGNYMFVEPNGQPAFVLSRDALASMLAANDARQVDEALPTSLLDRAIQSIQRLLTRLRAKETSDGS